MEIDTIYVAQQEQLTSLVLEHADRSSVRVPACPDWKVRDVLAHVVGLASDAVTGSLPAMDLLEQWRDDDVAKTRDRMTAAQVDRLANRSIDDLANDWRQLTGAMSPMLSGEVPFPGPAPFGLSAMLATDLVMHVQDVRGALGAPRPADGPALSIALATYCFGVDYRIRRLNLAALAVQYGANQQLLGSGEAEVTVTGDPFDLLRAFGGRRSRKQILAFDWHGDPSRYLAVIPAYGERADELVE